MATIKLLEETEMKKIMVGILTSVLIFAVCASSAFAAAPEKGDNFVDANEDGICDNYNSASGNGGGFTDEDNDGICDNRGNGGGQGNHRNFVDANEDGICDNYSGEASFSQNMGRGVGSRGRWGK